MIKLCVSGSGGCNDVSESSTERQGETFWRGSEKECRWADNGNY